MWLLKLGSQRLFLKLIVGLGSLWMLYLASHLDTGKVSGLIHSHSWLEFTYDDGGPEKVCDCSGIIQGEQEALEQAKLLTLTKRFRKSVLIPDEFYLNETQDCRRFKLTRKYLTFPLSKEEEDFPLAYSMVVHHKVQSSKMLVKVLSHPGHGNPKGFEWRQLDFFGFLKSFHFSIEKALQMRSETTSRNQRSPVAFIRTPLDFKAVQNFERLLRAIYAPQNVYCVHVDKKSPPSVTSAIQGITSCFPNVFMVSEAVSVVYAGWPRVQADLNCMADLYNANTKWKYFINLCGQDFPLKTNLEMVRILRSLKGSNSLESESLPEEKKKRILFVYNTIKGQIKRTRMSKKPPPFNLPIKSGSAYIVVTRGYVGSVLEDSRIEKLSKWFKDTYSPDEHFWATVQRISGVPGSSWPNRKYDQTDISAVARLVKWQSHEGSQYSESAVYPECQGNHVRSICVYGAGDLQWLLEHHHLFANKFDIEMDPIAVYCLEKYLRHKALAEAE